MKQIAAAAFVLAVSTGAAIAQCAGVEKKVCTLKAGWTENARPECDGTVDTEAQAVQTAFGLAHPALQRELCALENIFITDGDSFSVWLNPASGRTPNGEAPQSFIGINKQILTKSLGEVEDAAIHQTLTGGSKISPTHKVSSPAPDYAILAVMAHEVARVKWRRDNIYSSLHCYWPTFIDESWHRKNMGDFQQRASAPRFDRPEARHDGKGAAVEYNKRNLKHAHTENLTWSDVQKIYNDFATLIGGVSPEEDFAEAYKVVALNKSPTPVSLSLEHAGSSIPITSTNSHVVQRKLACVGDNLMPATAAVASVPARAAVQPSPVPPIRPEQPRRPALNTSVPRTVQ